MAILDRLFPKTESLAGQARKTTGYKLYSETPGVLFNSTATSSGEPMDEERSLTISAVFAAVNRLANVTAMLPLKVFDLVDGKKQENTTSPVTTIFAKEFNPAQTSFTARHFMQFWKPLFGCSAAEIGWDGAGRPRWLWPIEPWRIRPEWDDNGRTIHYLIDGQRKISAEDIVYVPHVTADGVTGLGFVQYALESLGQAVASDKASARFFKNDMRPGGILRHPNQVDQKTRKELREEWTKAHGGENRGSVGVLWGGWEWIANSGALAPEQAQLLQSRKYSQAEVARWTGVPLHWLAELDRATFSNIEHQGLDALVYTVQPGLTGLEQEYNRKLMAPPRQYCKHDVKEIVRADIVARGNFYRLMREIGVWNANDVLRQEDQDEIGPEGDKRYVPVNWQPADDIMTGMSAQMRVSKAKAEAKAAAAPEPQQGKPAAKAESQAVPVPTPRVADPAAVRAGLACLLTATFTHFLKKESNEFRRLAKNPRGVFDWMERFYPDFQTGLAEAIEPAIRLAVAAVGHPGDPAVLANDLAESHVRRSRKQILSAADAKPEAWPAAVTALLDVWAGPIPTATAREFVENLHADHAP